MEVLLWMISINHFSKPLFSTFQVYSSGVFELRLTSFTNERGLDSDGNCCNGVKDTTNSASGPVCTEKCHTFFTICLTNYMNDIPEDLSKEKCLFGYVNTDVLGYNNVDFGSIEGFNNVIVFHFNISWPVSRYFSFPPFSSLPE